MTSPAETTRRPEPIHPDALLAALVLAPGTYPRNRFLELYRHPAMKRVRRRAAQVRGLVRQLAGRSGILATELETTAREDGGKTLRYRVVALTMRVEVSLTAFEAAILDVALSRARGVEPSDEARTMVDVALHRLAESAPINAQ